MTIRLSFHGAARDVTGSCHLLEADGKRILIDCGLFQGSHDRDRRNADDFGFDPASIDTLLLTHAHLDHCGRIPLLFKRGFRGEIIATAATRDLAKLILLDAAHIEEDQWDRATRQSWHQGQASPGPLFTVHDAERSFDLFGRMPSLDTRIDLGRNLQVRFMEAGHILGSAFLVVDAGQQQIRRRIVFSGDLGPYGRSILPDPAYPPEADYVVMESTYGDRKHKALNETVREFHDAVVQTIGDVGNVIIPTFALERAQEILFYLRNGVAQGILPEDLPVFLDSPMAISATQIYRAHSECLRPAIRHDLETGHDPFDLPGLRVTRRVDESKALNRIVSGAVILAGSGMCNGGRVLYHLERNLPRPQSSIVFVGFAPTGTLAREIIDGARDVPLFGEPVSVRAKIFTINGFSAHAGQDELLNWYSSATRPRKTFLVHGDRNGGMATMARMLARDGRDVSCPALHDLVLLD